MGEEQDILFKVQKYRTVVLIYEGLHEQINKLIMQHGGMTENMSSDDLQRYRELAQKRDEVLNEMRYLESLLMDEDVL